MGKLIRSWRWPPSFEDTVDVENDMFDDIDDEKLMAGVLPLFPYDVLVLLQRC